MVGINTMVAICNGRFWGHTQSNVIIAAALILFIFSFQSSTTASIIPSTSGSEQGMVMVLTTPVVPTENAPSESSNSPPLPPEILSFRVQSDIKYRYSRTLVTSRVANKNLGRAQEVAFSVVLPDTAFISKFVMEIDGTAYEAYVKEKEEAKKDYVHAQSQGQSAGLIEKNTRNSNVFNVNVNVKAQSNVTFYLTYEELLARKLGRYEQAININPHQITSIPDYQIIVNIEESQNLTFVRVPSFSNDINSQDNNGNNRHVVGELPAPNKAQISWVPSTEDQLKLKRDGDSSKFVVQYDVDRENNAGQILLMQGYFVHFFSPESLPRLRKHVVFILDISGSMRGKRLEQLKESQKKILEDLSPDDYFNIITFSSGVNHWKSNNVRNQPLAATPENVSRAKLFIDSLVASGGTNIHGAIIEALNFIATEKEFEHSSDSIEDVGHLAIPVIAQSMILFLTDGEPTVGVTDLIEIQDKIQSANKKLHIPLYSLAFGEGADFAFLKKLSLQNNGFGRKIYEASDAALQLEGFYNEISSPLLSNVSFEYTSGEYNVTDVTLTKFPTVFGGAEVAVAGRFVAPQKPDDDTDEEYGTAYGQSESEETVAVNTSEVINATIGCGLEQLDNAHFEVTIGGLGRDGVIALRNVEMYELPSWCGDRKVFSPNSSVTNDSQSIPQPSTVEDKFLERLWAYLTISQLIEQDASGVYDASPKESISSTVNSTKRETPKQGALRLALKYGFVTPLTSLVVVKPNNSDITNVVSTDARPAPVSRQNAIQSSLPNHVVPTHSPARSSSTVQRTGPQRIIGFGLPSPQRNSLNRISHTPSPPATTPSSTHPLRPQWESGKRLESLSLIMRNRQAESDSERQRKQEAQRMMRERERYEQQHRQEAQQMEEMLKRLLQARQQQQRELKQNGVLQNVQLLRGNVPPSTTPAPIPSSTSSSPRLTLGDIAWLSWHSNVIDVEGTQYKIARSATSGYNEGHVCTNASTGARGHCRHLQNCVLTAFINDSNTYKDSYFCEITSASGQDSQSYAGVCCHSSNSVTTTRRGFNSPFVFNFSR